MIFHLVNSAIMPQPGNYAMKQISADQFAGRVYNAHSNGTLKTYIGYGSTAEVLSKLTAVNIKTSRQQTSLVSGDVLLVARLNYRMNAPSKKRGEFRARIEDFNFFWVDYTCKK